MSTRVFLFLVVAVAKLAVGSAVGSAGSAGAAAAPTATIAGSAAKAGGVPPDVGAVIGGDSVVVPVGGEHHVTAGAHLIPLRRGDLTHVQLVCSQQPRQRTLGLVGGGGRGGAEDAGLQPGLCSDQVH